MKKNAAISVHAISNTKGKRKSPKTTHQTNKGRKTLPTSYNLIDGCVFPVGLFRMSLRGQRDLEFTGDQVVGRREGGHLQLGYMLSSVHGYLDQQLQEHWQLHKRIPTHDYFGSVPRFCSLNFLGLLLLLWVVIVTLVTTTVVNRHRQIQTAVQYLTQTLKE